MNENHQQEVHYMNDGYSYPVSDGIVQFFGGVSAIHLPYASMGPMQDQESAYWSMNMNSYRYGLSGAENTSYYGLYADNGLTPRMDFTVRPWEYPVVTNTEAPITVDASSEENTVSTVYAPEERTPTDQDALSTEVVLQDDIDPDNMTYEELLDLEEAVGSESRGLSQELIDLLPTSKHKSGGIFSRRKSEDRCVICQMRYKRGDRLINLPCKHAYHTHCGSKWLSINKTCPVCNTEVFGDDSRL